MELENNELLKMKKDILLLEDNFLKEKNLEMRNFSLESIFEHRF